MAVFHALLVDANHDFFKSGINFFPNFSTSAFDFAVAIDTPQKN